MFGLFGNKNKDVKVIDHIWLAEQGKWLACLDQYRRHTTTVYIAWFEETQNNLARFFAAQGIDNATIVLAGFAHAGYNSPVVFIEHFPLQEEEQQKFKDLNLPEALVFSSLDEPVFQLFGGERIVEVIQKMGIREEEMIQHSMISSSIKKAQEKIRKQVIITTSARSQADWFANAGITNL